MALEIVSILINSMVSFHTYVKLPTGTWDYTFSIHHTGGAIDVAIPIVWLIFMEGFEQPSKTKTK